jgi:hypothetical protein
MTVECHSNLEQQTTVKKAVITKSSRIAKLNVILPFMKCYYQLTTNYSQCIYIYLYIVPLSNFLTKC